MPTWCAAIGLTSVQIRMVIVPRDLGHFDQRLWPGQPCNGYQTSLRLGPHWLRDLTHFSSQILFLNQSVSLVVYSLPVFPSVIGIWTYSNCLRARTDSPGLVYRTDSRPRVQRDLKQLSVCPICTHSATVHLFLVFPVPARLSIVGFGLYLEASPVQLANVQCRERRQSHNPKSLIVYMTFF